MTTKKALLGIIGPTQMKGMCKRKQQEGKLDSLLDPTQQFCETIYKERAESWSVSKVPHFNFEGERVIWESLNVPQGTLSSFSILAVYS